MWGSQGWNQWAMQPAMFNDIPHEQIDWAELAKQWIQMKQTNPASEIPPPLPPPLPPQVPAPPSSLPPPPPGLMQEEFNEKNTPPLLKNPVAPLLKTPMSVGLPPEPFHSDRQYQNEPAAYLPKTSENNFWNKSEWEGHITDEMDERMWSTSSMEPSVPLMAGKETFDYGHMHDNPPLAMQSIDYNHMSEFSYNSVYPSPAPALETQYDQYWSQVNVAPAISPMFLKKERSSALPVEEDSNQIDAAKRKQLPAWIRDGLEKMEQERLKRLEKEREAKESAAKSAALKKEMNSKLESSLIPAKSKFESDSEEGEIEPEEEPLKRNPSVEKRPPSPVEDLRTEEEKKQDLMLKVRRTLTEVLLSVTNSEMIAIAQDMLRKAISKAPARQLASSTSLSSVASGLRGLASYGTESDASEAEEEDVSDSEEELYQKIKEKKKLFALKERKIIADLEEKELQEKLNAEKLNNDKKSNKEHINSEKLDNLNNEFNTVKQESTSIPFLEQENQISLKESPIKSEGPKEIESEEPLAEKKVQEKNKNSKDKTVSTDSSSSSSDSESDSGDKRKKKTSKDSKKDKIEKKDSPKKDKKSSRKDSRRKRSRSRDSVSSGKHRRERSRDRKSKKKKSKRSDSSSSTSSSPHRKSRRSSKYESSRNHKDSGRNKSSDDRDKKRKRSVSPKSHRKSDSHSSRSHKYEDEKHSKRHKEEKRKREHRRSVSPHRGSKLPRKYRSSRSVSSESGSSGKKSKKSRNR